MSVKFFVTFKNKHSSDSDVTSGRDLKTHNFHLFFLFVFVFFASFCYAI